MPFFAKFTCFLHFPFYRGQMIQTSKQPESPRVSQIQNLAYSYRKVGHAGNMSDVAWQASSHNLVETSSYQRNSVVFVVRMALKAGLPPVANLSVGYEQTFG
jgi:hypothetical protein